MTPEKSLWIKVKKGLSPYLRMQRLEDRYSKGVPDVLYAGPRPGALSNTSPRVHMGQIGLLELKVRKEWPKRPGTPVRLTKWTKDQQAWHKLFGSLGQYVWLLLQVEQDYLLFHWRTAVTLGALTRKEMNGLCRYEWHKQIEFEQLAYALTDPLP